MFIVVTHLLIYILIAQESFGPNNADGIMGDAHLLSV